jgi:hypothetical protein
VVRSGNAVGGQTTYRLQQLVLRYCSFVRFWNACPMGRKSMVRKIMIAAASATILSFSSTAFTQQPGQFGTPAEAKAMLEKAIAAVKADKTKALDMFNKGESGFLDRDLYPFCFSLSDGKIVATQFKDFIGKDERTLKDVNGKPFGEELYKLGSQDNVVENSGALFPRPAADKTPVTKITFIARAGNVACGVGYYK